MASQLPPLKRKYSFYYHFLLYLYTFLRLAEVVISFNQQVFLGNTSYFLLCVA